jgi:hypothetical protein
MSRRNARTRRNTRLTTSFPDPFLALAAERAWRADDALDNGSVTTSLPNYIGAALPLANNGTGQAIKAANVNLNNRMAIVSAAGAARGYGNDVIYGAAPAALTIASVVYVTATGSGWTAITAGGVVNSGQAQLYGTPTVRSRKQGTDAIATLALPVRLVQVSVYTATTFTDYSNSLTGSANSLPLALAGTNLRLMELDAVGTFTLAGAWACMGYWTRALSAGEIYLTMRSLGRMYGIAITA